jgi:ribulose-bisphosphate carboxylase large chain
MRLLGMDLSVFVNIGGRFQFSREDCLGVAQRCREPLGRLRPLLPTPAGGMHLGNVAQMAEDYGPDTCLLIGGALLGHGDDLVASTLHFRETIAQHFGERREEPALPGEFDSACELPRLPTTERILAHLTHTGDFRWEGRRFVDYKLDQRLPHAGVQRLELIGPAGEATAFELRYFEVEAGGYTSLERHTHTHTLIGVRGEGVIVDEGARHALRPFDVAYVDQRHAHQLRNEGTEPFGFFCIVDRKRDRPAAP